MEDKIIKSPKIRFKGFTDGWKQCELGKNAIIKGRLGWKSLKQEEYTNEGPSMIAGKHIRNGIIDWSKVDHIPQWRYDESPEIMLENGDVIFSKDGSLGNPALIENLEVEATINSTMMLVRTDETINSNFFYQVLTSNIFKRLIYLKVSGSSIPHLFQADMNEFKFMMPTVQEQSNIGSLFKYLDRLIILQQRKLELVKVTKKSMLQKMFPKDGESVPEIRFAGFTDDWEQHKIGDLFKVTRGNVLAATETVNEKTNEMPYPVYSSQTKNNGLMGYYKDFLFDTAITWTTDGANAGTVNYREGRFYSTNVNGVLLSNEGFANKAVAEALNLVAYKYVSKVGNPKLMNNVMSEITINIPINLAEQNKISEYFTSLDNIITIHQRELDLLKDLKKSMLQQIFI